MVLCCLLTNRVADNGKPALTLQLQCKCENNCSAQIDLFLPKLYKFLFPKKIRIQASNFYGQGVFLGSPVNFTTQLFCINKRKQRFTYNKKKFEI